MSILDEIVAHKRKEVTALYERTSLAEMHDRAMAAPLPRGFKKALESRVKKQEVALVAEVKKASPSKGIIVEDFDPLSIAKAYQAGGAACLSVLTDEKYFQGHSHFLSLIRQFSVCPILRKDFMIDPIQIYEARDMGADAVLLIMRILSPSQLSSLLEAATKCKLDILLEVHDEEELARALEVKGGIIGINNRDLNTFETDLGLSEKLVTHIPTKRLVVAESGIRDKDDIKRLQAAGIYSYLIGEHLITTPNLQETVADWVAG